MPQTANIVTTGISPEVQQKLTEKAQVLTMERKKKGKMVPEELRTAEQIAEYKVIASHAVSSIDLLIEASFDVLSCFIS